MKNSDSRELRSTAEQFVADSRKARNRKRLAKATEEYFKSLSSEAVTEENAIAQSLRSTAIDLKAALED